MPAGYFVTGTDTGVGKTLVSCALLHAFALAGKTAIGMKPVAAGCEAGKWLDVEQLIAASTVSAAREWINPYALVPPIAPHIAAKQAGVTIDLAVIQQAFYALQKTADRVIVEGAGGFLVPLGDRYDTRDLACALGLPVVLVVGLRLGCLNHALLTAQAIQSSGLPLAGWVANQIDPAMASLAENIDTLQQRLAAPLLGVLPFREQPDAKAFATQLDTRLLG
ncbi:dethiobiotin synthetase [Nitrosomonas nitrosa]|uniref:ATP-dependent dethiobiotin synthetase BioD n=1 Tax=Nitrosomonas nitrosa TaxID=52442 RepID=A0A8H8Z1K9_9PROT|nr:dethiobiotin synthase [Nitrosomonas nitrosa]CAE6503893.1 dethiobiotin synthetase [Nitrosomonas nitrosa]